MQNQTNPAQTLEITPISSYHNPTSLNTPQEIKPSIQANPNMNQVFNPNINVVINQTGNTKENNTGPITVYEPPPKLDQESINMTCPFCKKPILTKVEKQFNIKAILTAIGTCFVGFVCLQICNNKTIGCQDSVHICPECNNKIGEYYIM